MLFAGSVVGVYSSLNARKRVVNEKRDRLTHFCVSNRFPRNLKRKLLDHLEFTMHNDKVNFLWEKKAKIFIEVNGRSQVGEQGMQDIDQLLQDLGDSLRAETVLFLHRNLIDTMPFFEDKSQEVLNSSSRNIIALRTSSAS